MRKLMMTLALLGAAGAAQAQGAPAGFHTHDGFFLNLEGGFGSLSSSTSNPGFEAKFSGTAGLFGITLGGALTPNFVLGAQFWGVSVASPDYKRNGVTLDTTDMTFGLSGFGVNLTYYFMPLNLYIAATPSIGMLSVKQGTASDSTKSGFALKLAVGKEWWVSDNWGLGLNVQYAHSSNEADTTNPPTWGTNFYGVAFSATYN